MRRGWLPLVLMTTLIVAVGAYSEAHHSSFLGKQNLNSLLLEAMPLVLVSMGQATALLVGGFDVSVAALMTMCVVTASFTMTPSVTGLALVPGALALVGVGVATGIFNAILIRVLRLPSIVATLGTLSVLEGASLLLRSYPQGPINTDVTNVLTSAVGFLPLAFVGVVAARRPRRRLALPLADRARAPCGRPRRDAPRAGSGCRPGARSSSRSSCAR